MKVEKISPRVPVDLKRWLIAFAKREGMTLEGAVTKFLREAKEKHEVAA